MKFQHLKKTREFSAVLQKGKRSREETLTAIVNKNPCTDGELRVGLVVSKKASGTSVRRNHIRRVIYHYFKESPGEIKEPTDVVIRVSRDVRNETKKGLSRILRKELSLLAGKARLYGR